MEYKEVFDLESLPQGMSKFFYNLITDSFGNPIAIPIVVIKGKPGNTIGITAALHGNELNGIPVIHRLIENLHDVTGTIVLIPVLNNPGFHQHKRRFGVIDPNRAFPGGNDGKASQIYVKKIFEIVKNFDLQVDLHTPGKGRLSSYYARADLSDPIIKKMAILANCDILLDIKGEKGTLRQACADINIPNVTLELSAPQRFQNHVIDQAYEGVMNILKHFKFIDGEIKEPVPIICKESIPLRTTTGGIVEIYPKLQSLVKKDEVIARVRNVFGEVTEEIRAPNSGIIIGKAENPIHKTGGLLCSLGLMD